MHEAIVVGALLTQLRLDPSARLVEGAAFERLVEIPRHAIELVLRMVALGIDDPILHRAFRGDENRQHLVVAQTHEIDALDDRGLQPRRHHQRGLSGQQREQLRGVAQDFAEVAHGARVMEFDLRAILEADSSRRREMIDVIAKRFFSGDSARRRMRLAQVAAILELGHHVADHRGAHAELMARDNLCGTDRLGSRDKLLHRRQHQRMLPVRKRVLEDSCVISCLITIVLRIQRYSSRDIVSARPLISAMASGYSVT